MKNLKSCSGCAKVHRLKSRVRKGTQLSLPSSHPCCLFHWFILSVLQRAFMPVCRTYPQTCHSVSKPKTWNTTSKERLHLLTADCEVRPRLPGSSTVILSSGSSVSRFCWLTRCLLCFPSVCRVHTVAGVTHRLVWNTSLLQVQTQIKEFDDKLPNTKWWQWYIKLVTPPWRPQTHKLSHL